MADNDYPHMLRQIAREMNTETGFECSEEMIIRDAAALIERQAAEIERLTPKPMTLEECCDALNREEYLYSIRPIDDQAWRVSRNVVFNGFDSFTRWEANVLANALQRDAKEDARG